MNRKFAASLFLGLLFLVGLQAHSGKPRYHVIIDTDGNPADMRAISMLLAGNDIRVLAISCSDGSLTAKETLIKVRSLLSDFHHEGIPTAAADGSLKLLEEETWNYKEKLTLVALGSLKNYDDWIKADWGNKEKIEKIICYDSQQASRNADYFRQSGIPLEIIESPGEEYPVNRDYLDHIGSSSSVYARQIKLMPSGNEEYLGEDLLPLYLGAPLLFDTKEKDGVRRVSLYAQLPGNILHEIIVKLLESSIVTNNRVFNSFPVDSSLYKPEYARILTTTIEKFGTIEWKAICMTNEIHGHTGIYSIVGAKLGIRAMEYFNVGINNLEIHSFAGNKPPLSCFNDGLQISTGATIGQGLITVSDTVRTIPTVLVTFNKRTIMISVKPEIADNPNI